MISVLDGEVDGAVDVLRLLLSFEMGCDVLVGAMNVLGLELVWERTGLVKAGEVFVLVPSIPVSGEIFSVESETTSSDMLQVIWRLTLEITAKEKLTSLRRRLKSCVSAKKRAK